VGIRRLLVNMLYQQMLGIMLVAGELSAVGEISLFLAEAGKSWRCIEIV